MTGRGAPRILVVAYACMPGLGSESGTGWAWARMIAGLGETWVLTRAWPGSPEELEAAVAATPTAHPIHVVVVPTPRLMPRRVDATGSTRLERAAYLLWQLAALRTARRLARTEEIDLVWHVTWANAWMGSIGGLVGRPFVLGPVGGGVGTPWRLLPSLGRRGAVAEIARSAIRTLARYLNPLARLAWSRAALILVQNEETRRWLPASARRDAVIFHHVALDPLDEARPTRAGASVAASAARSSRTAVFAGRLMPWKGAHLAVQAVAGIDGWRLVILGDGPERARLDALAARLGVQDRVELRGAVARPEALRILRDEADAFLFPSLHEEGGWAVGEALTLGVPVVCVARGGPVTMGARGVPTGTVAETVERLSRALVAAGAVERRPTNALTLEARQQALAVVLANAGLLRRPERLLPRSAERAAES